MTRFLVVTVLLFVGGALGALIGGVAGPAAIVRVALAFVPTVHVADPSEPTWLAVGGAATLAMPFAGAWFAMLGHALRWRALPPAPAITGVLAAGALAGGIGLALRAATVSALLSEADPTAIVSLRGLGLHRAAHPWEAAVAGAALLLVLVRRVGDEPPIDVTRRTS